MTFALVIHFLMFGDQSYLLIDLCGFVAEGGNPFDLDLNSNYCV